MENLTAKAFELRKTVLHMIYQAKTGHIGGDFSVMDILVTLYYIHMNVAPGREKDPDRDRFILSKGHSVESLYAVLCDKGFFPKEELLTYSTYLSKYIGHPNNKINGIEMNSGSLGHGLSVSVGMALAGKKDGRTYRVYTVMGDGELAEGSVWEGAMAAGHYKLDNLCAVVDRNRLQISGSTEDVMSHDNLEKRFASFGWYVIHAEGNSIKSLDEAFIKAKETRGMPTVIIADTTKGYGVSFMENKAGWHHKVPTEQELRAGLEELEEKRRAANE
ncbi:transketolase [Anaerocolumna cellulosilytica]|uniref:Transketolase n=1 Tax=Anaerocolumna cellulosilytica TaxID=433286 RepID=A0A6S6R986_9FIRM|nr:transketolase [Anaerocolumna cellulosilytica]MBB5195457.1 transketolase [Anaerocolumna cellulosilytica]BCJ95990.1 transketolase [Anaerocolumna cellulosilytica]